MRTSRIAVISVTVASAAVIFAAGVYVAHTLGDSPSQHLASQRRSRPTGSPSPSPTPSPSPSASTVAKHKRHHHHHCYDSCGQSEPVIFAVGNYSGTEPTTINISGDGGDIVTGLTWQSWPSCSTQASCNGLTAVGTGTVGIDSCKPNCAEGTITDYPTTITLSDPIAGTPTIWGELTQVTPGQPTYASSCAYPHQCVSGAS